MENNEETVTQTENKTEVSATQAESKNEEKTFTQEEVNAMIKKAETRVNKKYENFDMDGYNSWKESQKTESEKKLEVQQENEKLKREINALHLKDEATTYANSKGLPIGYLENINFETETSESIKEKIDKLFTLRSNDLKGYLNDKLKQESPKAVESKKENEDPYLKGFNDYFKKKK